MRQNLCHKAEPSDTSLPKTVIFSNENTCFFKSSQGFRRVESSIRAFKDVGKRKPWQQSNTKKKKKHFQCYQKSYSIFSDSVDNFGPCMLSSTGAQVILYIQQ